MNNTILVGRIASGPNIVELDEGKKCTTLTLAVNRNFKNAEGIYETDFIKCIMWNVTAATTAEYCRVGDIIGVKGRIQSSNYEDENGKKHYVTEVVGDKVTFLSSNKEKEKIENFVKSYLENNPDETQEIKTNEMSENSENKKKNKKKEQERNEIN